MPFVARWQELTLSGLMYSGPQMPFWPHVPISRPSRDSKLRVSCTRDLICPFFGLICRFVVHREQTSSGHINPGPHMPFWPHLPIHHSSRTKQASGIKYPGPHLPFLASYANSSFITNQASGLIYPGPHMPFLAPSPIVAHHKTSANICDLKRPHLPLHAMR